LTPVIFSTSTEYRMLVSLTVQSKVLSYSSAVSCNTGSSLLYQVNPTS